MAGRSVQEVYEEAKAAFDAGRYADVDALLEAITPDTPVAHAKALLLRAKVRCQFGEHWAALDLVRHMDRQRVSDEHLYLLGSCWQHLDQWQESERALRRAVAANPKHTDAWILLGIALMRQDNRGEARTCFDRALLNDQRALLARYYLAHLCVDAKDYPRAVAQLHVLMALQPDYPPGHRLHAEISVACKDDRQALVQLCWLAEHGFADLWCYQQMGRAFLAIGDRPQALKAYEQALRIEPRLVAEKAVAAQLSEEMGQFDNAVQLYRSLRMIPEHQTRAEEALARLEPKLEEVGSLGVPHFHGFRPPEVRTRGTEPAGPSTRPLGTSRSFQEGRVGATQPTLRVREDAPSTSPISAVDPTGPLSRRLPTPIENLVEPVARHLAGPLARIDEGRERLRGLVDRLGPLARSARERAARNLPGDLASLQDLPGRILQRAQELGNPPPGPPKDPS